MKAQKQQNLCETHNIAFDLIGYDKFCQLNCLICCDCLKTLDHKHKFEGINHKTIPIEQLKMKFESIRNFSIKQIKQCKQKLDKYFQKFQTELRKHIDQEKQRLHQLIQNIILTQITQHREELNILQNLLNERYQQVICKQVGLVSKKLYSFVPKSISPGFNIFREYVDERQKILQIQVQQLIKNPHYQTIVLKDAIPVIEYPQFKQQIKRQETPRKNSKTPRRKLRKQSPPRSPQKSLIDIKDFHVKIKKPLDFKGSQIIRNKQDISFIEKMFPMKVYGAKMLYKASQNNYSVKAFHQFCDGEPNTIVFVRTQFNKIIGGFTTIPWKSTNNTLHADVKKQSFLFSISLKQKMKLVDEKSAIFNSVNFGPTFGGGADLAICHNCNTQKTSYSEFPFSYANPRYMENNQHSTFLYTGQQNGNHFFIKEWEVWKLDFNQ